MKYSININQKALLEIAPALNIEHYAIIDYLKHICLSASERVDRQRVSDEDGERWTWVDLSHARKELPCLKIKSNSTMSRRVQEICEVSKAGKRLFHKSRKRGNRLYIRPGTMLTLAEFHERNSSLAAVQFQNCSSATNHNTNNHNTNNHKTTRSSEKFEEFWKAYPKKVGKKKAEKKFSNLIENRDEIFDDIMQGLEKYKQSELWQKDDGSYVMNPTTFLNGERWNDQVSDYQESNVEVKEY